jgi:protein-S-isoprenylcysteine O-methyltransferase Ste14
MFPRLLQLGVAQFGLPQLVAFVEISLCWFIWSLAFIRPRRQAARQIELTRASASRWGIFFNFLGSACIFAYIRPAGFAKTLPELTTAMLFAPLAVVLAWRATRHLGKQWRYQAAISQGHELITTGPYARLRHPIYASLLLMQLATGLAYTWWPLLVAGILLSLIGFEIRIHAEDRLLEQYFQDEFLEWRGRTKAYIPFIR